MDSISLQTLSIRIIWYIISVIVTIGIFGNVLGFVVCSVANLKNTIFSVYFRFIFVLNTLILFLNTFLQKVMVEIFNIRISVISNDLCRLTKIIAYSLTVSSGWILVAISLDRYISIAFPARLSMRKNWKFQISVCFIFVVKDLIYYGQLFFSYVNISISNNNTTNHTIERANCEEIEPILLRWLDLINSSILPGFLLLICTYLILNTLSASRKHLKNYIKNKYHHEKKHTTKQKTHNRERNFATSSLGWNIFFLLTNIPLMIWDLYQQQQIPVEPLLKKVIISFLYLVYYTQYGSLFLINILVSSIFRDEVSNLFGFFLKNMNLRRLKL